MKKFVVPVVCALVGCAAGVAMPAITAPTYGASPLACSAGRTTARSRRCANALGLCIVKRTVSAGIKCFEYSDPRDGSSSAQLMLAALKHPAFAVPRSSPHT